MSITILPPEAIGYRDDGHPSGLIRVERVDGELVRYPFRAANYYAQPFGTASVALAPSGSPTNPDGTGTVLNIGVPTGAGNGIRLWYPFSGRAFGVRFQAFSTTPDFSVVVDGEAVRVHPWPDYLTAEGITNQIAFGEAQYLTHDNLDRGPHIAEILFPAPAGGTSQWALFGLLLDRGAGYTEVPRSLHAIAPVALTTADVGISLATGVTGGALRGLRQIVYTNTTASPVIVTIKSGATVVWSRSVPANDVVVFDPGGMLTMGWTHAASAGSAINATVIGGY